MVTLEFNPPGPPRAVLKVQLHMIAPKRLAHADLALLNERINQLFEIGPARVGRPPAPRDYHAAAKLINRPMSAGEAQDMLREHFSVGESAIRCNHWPRVKPYLKWTEEGFIYDTDSPLPG